ncbi:MAG TPA: endonuclease/exonuclease/phosphatase family protein [Candidatus Saccharimonadales bacterium]|nr:endonuclease/exonuclease/phosphatase family protein [Candidatus Saccharimonadales bacterium]
MKMTFTSLNVQGFDNWENRQVKIIDYLQRTDPDIVLFQEVTFLPQISSHNQVGLLNKSLAYPYENTAVTRLQDSPHYETYREGLGVISKWPITNSETIILKQNPEDEHQRIVQLIDITCDNQVIKFANIHFSISDTNENFPRDHLQELLDIFKSRNEVRIIGGDFNMNDIDLHADLWQDAYISSSTVPYMTFPGMNKRVDYFLLPKDHAFLDIFTSPDDLSDHRALSVTVKDAVPLHTIKHAAAPMDAVL